MGVLAQLNEMAICRSLTAESCCR